MTWLTDLIINYGMLGLFINVFLAFSILPSLTSLPMIIALQFFDPWAVFFISFIAATLGSMTNYYIGLKGIRRFMPKESKLKKAKERIDRWGPLTLALLSWLPIVGDPLIVAAGVFKMDFWKFMFYSAIARFGVLIVIIFFGSFLNGGWV